MSERDFALVDPFETDDGELDGHRLSFAFLLGVEWATFRARAREDAGRFVSIVHVENRGRLLRLLKRHGRGAAARSIDGTWVEIAVLPRVYN